MTIRHQSDGAAQPYRVKPHRGKPHALPTWSLYHASSRRTVTAQFLGGFPIRNIVTWGCPRTPGGLPPQRHGLGFRNAVPLVGPRNGHPDLAIQAWSRSAAFSFGLKWWWTDLPMAYLWFICGMVYIWLVNYGCWLGYCEGAVYWIHVVDIWLIFLRLYLCKINLHIWLVLPSDIYYASMFQELMTNNDCHVAAKQE